MRQRVMWRKAFTKTTQDMPNLRPGDHKPLGSIRFLSIAPEPLVRGMVSVETYIQTPNGLQPIGLWSTARKPSTRQVSSLLCVNHSPREDLSKTLRATSGSHIAVKTLPRATDYGVDSKPAGRICLVFEDPCHRDHVSPANSNCHVSYVPSMLVVNIEPMHRLVTDNLKREGMLDRNTKCGMTITSGCGSGNSRRRASDVSSSLLDNYHLNDWHPIGSSSRERSEDFPMRLELEPVVSQSFRVNHLSGDGPSDIITKRGMTSDSLTNTTPFDPSLACECYPALSLCNLNPAIAPWGASTRSSMAIKGCVGLGISRFHASDISSSLLVDHRLDDCNPAGSSSRKRPGAFLTRLESEPVVSHSSRVDHISDERPSDTIAECGMMSSGLSNTKPPSSLNRGRFAVLRDRNTVVEPSVAPSDYPIRLHLRPQQDARSFRVVIFAAYEWCGTFTHNEEASTRADHTSEHNQFFIPIVFHSHLGHDKLRNVEVVTRHAFLNLFHGRVRDKC